MYSDVKKNRAPWILSLFVLLCVVLLAGFFWLKDPARDLSEESAAAIREAVRSSALQCYAVEGVYPPDLAYLEDNYGLHVNTGDFYVTYDAFASNIAPTVIVTPK